MPRTRCGVASSAAAALLTVLVLAGCGSQDGGGLQSAGDVDTALLDGGLVVCSSRAAPDPPGTNALESRLLVVGTNDPGELSAEGLDSDGVDTCSPRAVAQVTVSSYPDQDARNAGAQALQGLLSPGDGAGLHTSGNLTILVQSTSFDAPTNRVNEVLARVRSG